jgi:type VI secretion system secreted protein VgrG
MQIEQEFRTGKYALTDYNFETPSTSLMAEVQTTHEAGGNGKFEYYDYPGEYEKKAQGDKIAKIRIEEEEAQYLVIRGTSVCRDFTSGYRFDLKDYFRADMNQSYVLTQVQHAASIGEAYRSAGSGHEHSSYSNTFTAIPHKIPYRPVRLTPKPIVQGPQTAVVVGPGGEEIYSDKYGRVKVQFFWDREGKKNESSSCWVRVSQLWAGKQWGAIFIPRIGQEVMVEFMEGDPDHPIITGRVYNAEMMPPYALPANQTQSGIKSRSSKGASPDNFNEIRFEDKKGEEQLFIHAEKNQDIEVENDETHSVGHDRKKDIKNDETVSVGRDRSETVGNNETISIGKDRTENVEKNESITIGANRTESVGKNEDITIGENRTENVTKNEDITIGESRKEQVGKDEDVSIGGARTLQVEKNNSVDVGKKFTLVAGDEISLTTGDASIVMKKNGDIQITGNKITINGSGKITVKSDSDLIMKGSKITQN